MTKLIFSAMPMTVLHLIFRRVLDDKLLIILMIMLPILILIQPQGAVPRQTADLQYVVSLVDWHTIFALAGLMLLSRGLEDSGYLAKIADWLHDYCHSERQLALLLLWCAAILSAVVTNDVALFILAPICLSLASLSALPAGRLIIFVALAVNAGSTLSPIGNPQNLFLWQASGFSFWHFTWMMLPLALLLLLLLSLLCWRAFSANALQLPDENVPRHGQHALFRWSLLGYPLFILAIEFELSFYATLVLLLCYGWWKRQVVLGIDWGLLLVFMLMFVDLGLLSQLPSLQQLITHLMTWPAGTFFSATLLSQLISNVPAAILLQHFTDDWRALSYGVSVGGFGLAIGSLANLIALRLAKQPGLWREFHRWSLPVFAVSVAIAGCLLWFIKDTA